MKNKLQYLLLTLALLAGINHVFAQGTAFTYQGQLLSNGIPVTGTAYLKFALYTNQCSPAISFEVAGPTEPVTLPCENHYEPIPVTNGLFTVYLDFGGPVFDSSTLWLAIYQSTDAGATYTMLTNLPVTPTPYSIYAENAGNATFATVAGTAANLESQVAIGEGSGDVIANEVSDAFIGGGQGNNIQSGASYAVIAGGDYNIASASEATVSGGTGNTASQAAAAVGGGQNNWAEGEYSFVGGGMSNSAGDSYFAYPHEVDEGYAVVGGGFGNGAFSAGSFIGGGGFDGFTFNGNIVQNQAFASAIVGGIGNQIQGGANYAFIGSGNNNTNSGVDATISGGQLNIAYGQYDTISGGQLNTVSNQAATVSGGQNNKAIGTGSFIGGGGYDGTAYGGNIIRANAATIGGGLGNTIQSGGTEAFIGGGQANLNNGADHSVIGGGQQNEANDSASYSTVGGGYANYVDQLCEYSTIGGGNNNSINDSGGEFNPPYGATIPGGENNQANGNDSFAAGNSAQANADNSFVWSDGSQTTTSMGNQTFVARATGGFFFQGGTVSVPVLTITGGSDVAEPFKMSEGTILPGSVVIIDEDHPGKLKLSDQPYDGRVAGVVSGANGIHPGIQMQQQGLLEGGQNVALTGRVYVKADTSNGQIHPGDLLTTSGIPGDAMKVTDHLRAQGAILGKAMTSLSEGRGTVLVLVSLQ